MKGTNEQNGHDRDPRKTPARGGARQLGRQRARVLRLLHLRHGGRARLRPGLLPRVGPRDRDPALVRHLRRRLRRTPDRRVLHGPHRRPLRPQARPAAHRVAHGRRHVPRRLPADLRLHRHLGTGAARRAATAAGLLGLRRAGGGELAQPRTRPRAPSRVLHELHAQRHADRPDHRHRRLPADRRHARGAAPELGLAHPVLAQRRRRHREHPHPPPHRGAARLPRGGGPARRRVGPRRRRSCATTGPPSLRVVLAAIASTVSTIFAVYALNFAVDGPGARPDDDAVGRDRHERRRARRDPAVGHARRPDRPQAGVHLRRGRQRRAHVRLPRRRSRAAATR